MSGKKRKLSSASWVRGTSKAVPPAVKNYVSRRLSRVGEHKTVNYETAVSVGTQASAPFNNSICLIPQGAGDGQRIGDKISLKKLNLKIAWFGSDAIQVCRFIAYRKTNYQTTMTTSYNDFPDPQNYQILADWQDSCSGTLAPNSKTRSLTIPLSGKVTYVGTGDGDDKHGAIWLHATSDSSAVTHPSLYVSAQVTYTDV